MKTRKGTVFNANRDAQNSQNINKNHRTTEIHSGLFTCITLFNINKFSFFTVLHALFSWTNFWKTYLLAATLVKVVLPFDHIISTGEDETASQITSCVLPNVRLTVWPSLPIKYGWTARVKQDMFYRVYAYILYLTRNIKPLKVLPLTWRCTTFDKPVPIPFVTEHMYWPPWISSTAEKMREPLEMDIPWVIGEDHIFSIDFHCGSIPSPVAKVHIKGALFIGRARVSFGECPITWQVFTQAWKDKLLMVFYE